MVARSHSWAVNKVAVFSSGNAPVSTPGFGGVMSFFMSVHTSSQTSRLLYPRADGERQSVLSLYWVALILTVSSHKALHCHVGYFMKVQNFLLDSAAWWNGKCFLSGQPWQTLPLSAFISVFVRCFICLKMCSFPLDSSRLHLADTSANHLLAEGHAAFTSLIRNCFLISQKEAIS